MKRLFLIFFIVCFVPAVLNCCSSKDVSEAKEDSSSIIMDSQSISGTSEDAPLEITTRKLTSAHFLQSDLTDVYWECKIYSREDLKEIEALFTTDTLMQLDEHDERWPNGGIPIMFYLEYDDEEIEGCVYPQPPYRIKSEENRSTLRLEETFYKYPEYKCEDLLSFLSNKGVVVIG